MLKDENMEKSVIQWYPGHMAKAHRVIKEHLKLVDVVVELLDARVPKSSANPMIGEVTQGKRRLIALNKEDLADDVATRNWVRKFKREGQSVVMIDALTGKGMRNLVQAIEFLAREKTEHRIAKGMRTSNVRAMILGIPNVGKSSLINRLRGSAVAKTADRPGVTRSKQWLKVNERMDVLDTPGVLWPKFEDEAVGLHLAFTGAISDAAYDAEQVARKLLLFLAREYPAQLIQRYKLDASSLSQDVDDLLAQIGANRGCLRSGGSIDREAAQRIVLNEFRTGKLGRITLEKAEI